ncbi:hypothetical protein AAMO2058_000250700 [Amorphochlora amoebiformis]
MFVLGEKYLGIPGIPEKYLGFLRGFSTNLQEITETPALKIATVTARMLSNDTASHKPTMAELKEVQEGPRHASRAHLQLPDMEEVGGFVTPVPRHIPTTEEVPRWHNQDETVVPVTIMMITALLALAFALLYTCLYKWSESRRKNKKRKLLKSLYGSSTLPLNLTHVHSTTHSAGSHKSHVSALSLKNFTIDAERTEESKVDPLSAARKKLMSKIKAKARRKDKQTFHAHPTDFSIDIDSRSESMPHSDQTKFGTGLFVDSPQHPPNNRYQSVVGVRGKSLGGGGRRKGQKAVDSISSNRSPFKGKYSTYGYPYASGEREKEREKRKKARRKMGKGVRRKRLRDKNKKSYKNRETSAPPKSTNPKKYQPQPQPHSQALSIPSTYKPLDRNAKNHPYRNPTPLGSSGSGDQLGSEECQWTASQ